MIRALDRGVGRVLDALEANGLDENTLVLFTSDNGGAGYIGVPGLNAPYRGWKLTSFEGGIRVPFFARWPARIPPGVTFEAPVHHFDLYATAAAAGGAPLPTDRVVDGVDLLPFVRGEVEGVPHEKLFWRSGASRAARMGRYKLVVSAPWGLPRREWLFDLEADHGERRDLATERPELLDEMRGALQEHLAEQPPPLWQILGSQPINLDRDLSQLPQPGDEFAYW
jgi:arylsulfatase A-like enzyme